MRRQATDALPASRQSARAVRAPARALFAALDANERARLLADARRLRLRTGDVVFRQGDAADGLYLLLSGRLDVTRTEHGEELLLGVQRAGDFVGEIALLGNGARSATVTASAPSKLLVIEPAAFRALLTRQPEAALAVLRTISARLAATESTLIRHEKLAALGTLAAGLAHDLNNPASAARRSAAQLRDAIDALSRSALRLASVPDARVLAPRLLAGPSAAAAPPAADGDADIEAEARLGEWLAEFGMADAQHSAYALAACGWTIAELRQRLDGSAPDAQRRLIEWLTARCETAALTQTIGAAAEAIAAVVAAVRTHAHLDRAPVQPIDVRASIDAALLVLRSRRPEGVSVQVEIPAALPPVEAHGGELGQVWTNLIANAFDATGSSGRLRIAARPRGDWLLVDVENDGPPIPRGVVRRVFEPYFTTKPPGSGSGLGLHIARDIVVRHGGRIAVRSRPGRTVFRVVLPLRA